MINSDLYTLADFIKSDGNIFGREMTDFFNFVEDYKHKRHFYYERPLLSACKNRVKIYDRYSGREKEMIMMASNNYLGLASHPKIIEAGLQAAQKYGFGSGGVPLFSGTYDLHKELESKIAQLKGCEDAVIFPSGYTANVGCLTALARENDALIHDRLNHASLIDGARFSGAILKVFRHNDPNHLEKVLKGCQYSHARLIVVDGVFSMDGDIADIPSIKYLADKYGALVMIDEAHATGVIGKTGKGTPEHHNLQGEINIVAGTLSKALAGVGGFIASTKEVVNYIRFYARSNMFSTSLPPPTVAALIVAIDVLETEPIHNKRLKRNIQYMTTQLRRIGFNIGKTESAIIPIIVGDELKLRKMAKTLHECDIYANPVPYPAVPKKLSRIRLSIMSTHTKEDLDKTLEVLDLCGRKFGLINQESMEICCERNIQKL